MFSGTSTLDATAVLAAARRARVAANAAEADVLASAVEWARLHEVDNIEDAATWSAGRGVDTGIAIAGQGAPLVSEFAVAEFAAALGLSAESGRNLVGQALELAHRLVKVWARVRSGQLAPWRARRIAEYTLPLSPEAAAFVDAQVAPFAHKIGLAATERLVETAIARFMPDFAAERRDRAAGQRYFAIEHDQVSFAGTSRVHGELDLADALDLEDAIATGAAQLAALGNTDTLDVRRAAAVGILARGEQPLNLGAPAADPAVEPAVEPAEVPGSTPGSSLRGPQGLHRREVVLYVHLSEQALRTHDPDAPVRVENAGGQLLTAGQVADWCQRTDTTRVVVKPVIDLAELLSSDAYKVPEAIAEQVRLRDKTCVHTYCHRPARSCDVDHIVPYDEDGPPGQTNTENLACLCRLHHRMKTHGGWNYTMLEPGVFLWRSPHGQTYLRDRTGTTDLTPPPVQPPER
jgi:5-methylcytosine-specific restriction endonuclease McrA